MLRFYKFKCTSIAPHFVNANPYSLISIYLKKNKSYFKPMDAIANFGLVCRNSLCSCAQWGYLLLKHIVEVALVTMDVGDNEVFQIF